MFYSIKSKIWHYLCSDKTENKFLELTISPRRTGDTKIKFMTEMKRTNDTIEMLQYQLKRYKAMKKGAACQSLQVKLYKLMSQANG